MKAYQFAICDCETSWLFPFFYMKKQGSKNPLVRSFLRLPQAAGQVKIWMISNVN